MLNFLKTTVLGGILFLIPIVIFITIIGKALQITNKLAIPIAGLLGAEKITGIAVAELIAIAILVLACFIAGLAAKTARAKKLVQSLEANVLDKIPVYELLKAKTQSVLSFEEEETLALIMVRFDDSWQLAFEIERIERDKVVIFLPGAPDPWAGSVCIVTEDRVTHLEMTIKSAVKLMKRLGKGSTDLLKDPQDLKA
jgi:uncharacterized membrane protein